MQVDKAQVIDELKQITELIESGKGDTVVFSVLQPILKRLAALEPATWESKENRELLARFCAAMEKASHTTLGPAYGPDIAEEKRKLWKGASKALTMKKNASEPEEAS
jgi:hypothetical protein